MLGRTILIVFIVQAHNKEGIASKRMGKSDTHSSDGVGTDTKRASQLSRVMVVVRRTEKRTKAGKSRSQEAWSELRSMPDV
jgi:hypothetical protein